MKTRRSLYVVEIKHRQEIGEEVVNEVQTKIEKMKVKKGFSVFPVLVACGHVSARVSADGYFARIITAEQMMGRI